MSIKKTLLALVGGFIRTVKYFNPVSLEYDTRDWYQCVLCGYETFFVHNDN